MSQQLELALVFPEPVDPGPFRRHHEWTPNMWPQWICPHCHSASRSLEIPDSRLVVLMSRILSVRPCSDLLVSGVQDS